MTIFGLQEKSLREDMLTISLEVKGFAKRSKPVLLQVQGKDDAL